MSDQDQIAIGLAHGMPGSDWGNCTDYAMLQATWRDKRPIPTKEQILKWFAESPLNPSSAAAAARKVWPDAAAFVADFAPGEIVAIARSTDDTLTYLDYVLKTWQGPLYSDEPRVQAAFSRLLSLGILSEERVSQILAK